MEKEGEVLRQFTRMKIEEEKENGSELRPLHEVENILAYDFKNRRLLENAFTPANTEFDKLEYLGDLVLNALVTRKHIVDYPTLSSGKLTKLRSVNVDTEKLARVAIKHRLHRYLYSNNHLLHERIEEFAKEIEEYPLHSHGLIDAPKALADLVASLIGAVYTDTDFCMDTVWKVFGTLLEPFICPLTFKSTITS